MQPSTKLALYYARQCQQAYDFPSDRNENVQCHIVRNNTHLSIAIAGTNDGKDIRSDFRVWKSATLYGRVHTGFWDEWIKLRHIIEVQLNQGAVMTADITGHSLGAAMACLCGMYLRDYGVTVNPIYTFGQPRIGDRDFVGHCNKRVTVFRYASEFDPITRWPKVNYYHNGKAIYINKNGVIDSRRFWNILISLWGNITNHELKSSYIKDLELQVKRER